MSTKKSIGDQLIAAAKKIDFSYSTDNKNDLSEALDIVLSRVDYAGHPDNAIDVSTPIAMSTQQWNEAMPSFTMVTDRLECNASGFSTKFLLMLMGCVTNNLNKLLFTFKANQWYKIKVNSVIPTSSSTPVNTMNGSYLFFKFDTDPSELMAGYVQKGSTNLAHSWLMTHVQSTAYFASEVLDESTTKRLFGSSISNNQQMWWTIFGHVIPGISYTVD